MEWIEIFEAIKGTGIIGWIIGLIGVTFITALWKVVKEGYEVYNKYKQYSADDKWTEEELRDYVIESGQYWEAMSNFWKVLLKAFRKIFTKSGK